VDNRAYCEKHEGGEIKKATKMGVDALLEADLSGSGQ